MKKKIVGPPGVGKTTMAHAVAEKAGWESMFISNGHLSDKYTQFSLQTTPVVLDDQKDHFAERLKCAWSAKVPFSVHEALASDIDKRYFQKK